MAKLVLTRAVVQEPYEDWPNVSVGAGFWSWYTSLRDSGVNAALASLAASRGVTRVSITGHSSGAACATLLAVDIARGAVAGVDTVQGVVTFGSPRVGNAAFVAAHGDLRDAGKLPDAPRVTHWKDIIPHMPPESLGYLHLSTEVFYDEPSASYTVCDGTGEDESCSNRCFPFCTSKADHLAYLNVTMGIGGC